MRMIFTFVYLLMCRAGLLAAQVTEQGYRTLTNGVVQVLSVIATSTPFMHVADDIGGMQTLI